MMKLKLATAAAAILTATAAMPASAQEVIYNPGYCAQFYPNANCQNKGPNNPYTGDYQRRAGMERGYANRGAWVGGRDDYRWGGGNAGFWPGAVAGAAIGTAGAIATAPFRGANASMNYGGPSSYASRNGFVCEPGTFFRGEDGRRHLCQ
jgi:hypothetical protein